MKKLLMGLLLMSLVGCSSTPSDPFITEYEALNGTTTESGMTYLDLDIPEDHRFVMSDEESILDIFNGGNGVIYFGFPECPWCRSALMVMQEAAKDVSLGKIHYLNVLDIRNELSLDDDGNVVVDKQGSDFYNQVLEYLGEHAPLYPGLEETGERRILVPLVVSVVEGEITFSHSGTVETHTNPFEPMDDVSREALLNIYKEGFLTVTSCSIEVAC
ncbi:MAG TPA: hypothetical protein VKY25_04325 [Erysipelothrix sp.]|nr:hypothetical protein [Erysipelothrix sp.]